MAPPDTATVTSPARTRPAEGDTRGDPRPDDGDHDRMSHIVLEGFRPEGGDDVVSVGRSVVEGIVTGTAVRALCGKEWVPGRDPKRYPMCPTCREIAEGMGWRVPSI